MTLETTSIEYMVLRTVMDNPESYDVAETLIQARDFSDPANRILWQTIVDLIALRRPFDIDSVFHHLQERNLFDVVGGLDLYKCLAAGNYSAPSGVEGRCQRIREVSLLRTLRQSALAIVDLMDNHDGRPFEELLAEAEGMISEVTAGKTGNEIEIISGPELMNSCLADFVEAIENPGIKGISTGIESLDQQSDGLQKGESIIVAGPPSMGKTTFAVNLVQNALYTAEHPVVIFSMEMPAKDIGRRMWSTESRVNYQEIRRGTASQTDSERMISAMKALSSPMLKIISHSPMTPSKVRSVLKKLKRQYGGVRMAMIDYVQLMEADKKSNNRNDELTVISRELKRMALEFNMPFIVLSQLTKAVETAKRKPTNGDLRESGALAQDADMIMMVHRQEKYEEDNQDHIGKAEIIITKSRNGKTGTTLVGFDGATFRFYELPGAQSWKQ